MNGTISAANPGPSAALRYTDLLVPGVVRRRSGKGFAYRWPDGRPVVDAGTRRWIRAIAIPPAWTDVWISPDPSAHILAYGRDQRGRRQYRYHPDWHAGQQESKFERILAFARKLPDLRNEVRRDLGRPGFGKRKVLAAVIELLETTLIRVGNEEYARLNKSYGLTTLRNRHVRGNDKDMRFVFNGKSGKRHEVTITDRRLIRIVGKLQELPGQTLLQYVDDDGSLQPVTSDDVNTYLREAIGSYFSAKDFRTWAGTVHAAWSFHVLDPFETPAGGKRNVNRAMEQVALRLGNTPAICRKSYVHPEIVVGYLDGTLCTALAAANELADRSGTGLAAEELAVLSFLSSRLATRSIGNAP